MTNEFTETLFSRLYEDEKIIKFKNVTLNEDGHLYIVIRKAQGAASSIKELETLFGTVVVIQSKAGYKVIDCHN